MITKIFYIELQSTTIILRIIEAKINKNKHYHTSFIISPHTCIIFLSYNNPLLHSFKVLQTIMIGVHFPIPFQKTTQALNPPK
jgi:hypothetical protein